MCRSITCRFSASPGARRPVKYEMGIDRIKPARIGDIREQSSDRATTIAGMTKYWANWVTTRAIKMINPYCRRNWAIWL